MWKNETRVLPDAFAKNEQPQGSVIIILINMDHPSSFSPSRISRYPKSGLLKRSPTPSSSCHKHGGWAKLPLDHGEKQTNKPLATLTLERVGLWHTNIGWSKMSTVWLKRRLLSMYCWSTMAFKPSRGYPEKMCFNRLWDGWWGSKLNGCSNLYLFVMLQTQKQNVLSTSQFAGPDSRLIAAKHFAASAQSSEPYIVAKLLQYLCISADPGRRKGERGRE